MPILRLFGPARERAGVARIDLPGRDVSEVLAAAELHFGPPFTEVLAASRVWVNGESADSHLTLSPDDEVAVLPPVSGG